jgi:bacterial/archaeal transporter family protein
MKRGKKFMAYTWIVFALFSALMAALVAIFGKIGLEGIDANVATMIRGVVMAVLLILFIGFTGNLPKVIPIVENSKAMIYIVMAGVAGALSWLFYFLALKLADKSQVSGVAAIDRLSIVFVIIFALLFLGQKLTLKVSIGAVLVAVGAILIAI